MARPRRIAAEPSTETLSLRITRTEMQTLDHDALARGVSRVEAVRQALTLLHVGEVPEPPPPPPTIHGPGCVNIGRAVTSRWCPWCGRSMR
jgi:hypothetical protein